MNDLFGKAGVVRCEQFQANNCQECFRCSWLSWTSDGPEISPTAIVLWYFSVRYDFFSKLFIFIFKTIALAFTKNFFPFPFSFKVFRLVCVNELYLLIGLNGSSLMLCGIKDRPFSAMSCCLCTLLEKDETCGGGD